MRKTIFESENRKEKTDRKNRRKKIEKKYHLDDLLQQRQQPRVVDPDPSPQPLCDPPHLRQVPVLAGQPPERPRHERRDVGRLGRRVEVERAERLTQRVDFLLREEEEGRRDEVPGAEPGDEGAPLRCVCARGVGGGIAA